MANRKRQAENLIKGVMKQTKVQRKASTKIRVKDLAAALEKTNNYITNIENGHATPSGTTFLEYLIECGVDLTPLKHLKIEADPRLAKKRQSFVNEVYALDEPTLNFLKEQLDLLRITLTSFSLDSDPKTRRKTRTRKS